MSSFDDIIRQKAMGHEAPVAADAWNRISGKRRRKKPAAWFILPLLMVAGGLLWFVWNQNRTTSAANPTVNRTENQSTGNATTSREAATSKEIRSGSSASLHPITNPSALASDNATPDAKQYAATHFAAAQHHDVKGSLFQGAKSVATDYAAQDAIRKSHPKQKRSIQKKYKLQTSQGETGQDENQSVSASIEKTGTGLDAAILESNPVAANQQPASVIIDPVVNRNNTDSAKTSATPVIQLESSKPVNSTATPSSGKSPAKKKWWLETGFTPQVPITPRVTLPSIIRTTTSLNTRTVFSPDQYAVTLKPSVAFHAMAVHDLSHRWQWAAGLQYLQITEELQISGPEQTTLFTQVSRLDNSSGTAVLIHDTVATSTTGIRSVHAVNQMRFIELPVLLRYQFRQSSRIQWSVTGGFSLNYLASYINLIQPAFSTQSPVKNQRYGVDFCAGMMVSGPLRNRLQWYIQPQGRFNLKQAHAANMLQTYPLHWFGLGMGIRIPLNH